MVFFNKVLTNQIIILLEVIHNGKRILMNLIDLGGIQCYFGIFFAIYGIVTSYFSNLDIWIDYLVD